MAQPDEHTHVEQLQAALAEAQQAQGESLAQAQRSLADYANLKKRYEKERQEMLSLAQQMLLMQLLPAFDNLDRAVKLASDDDRKASIFMGVTMTLQQIHDTLAGAGFTKLDVRPGQPFSADEHEAVEAVDGPKDAVVQVLDAGYALHGKAIRPARVTVGRGDPDTSASGMVTDHKDTDGHGSQNGDDGSGGDGSD